MKETRVYLYSQTVTYNGKMRTPVVTVIDSSGTKLIYVTDYTVDEPDGRTNAGTYIYTITGMDNYIGTVQKVFTILSE